MSIENIERRFLMVRQEWKNIFHNAWIIVVIIAIIAIPSIYSCVFLGSMWDPDGNTGEIPVFF